MEENKRKKGRLHTKRLVDALASGKTHYEAGKYAGSLAEKRYTITSAVTRKMKTPEFKKEARKVVERLESIRDQAIAELEVKDVTSVDYSKLTEAIEKQTKMIELLSNRPTERKAVDMSEVAQFLDNA